MPVTINVDGLAAIKVGTGADQALETLGYTRNGVEITVEGFFLDVPGDENGGDDGPPIDIQDLGQIARARLELTKFDNDIADKIKARLRGGTAGVQATPGTLLFQGDKAFRLLIHPAGATPRVMNFLRAIPRMPFEENKGTKFSTLILEFEAHKTGSADDPANTLWNESYD